MPEILPLSSKPIAWIGAAYDELMDLPVAVRRTISVMPCTWRKVARSMTMPNC